MFAAVKSLQSCPTLCDPIDSSPPGSPIPGILQARTVEWVAISFSNAWKWKVKVKSLSRARLLATPWTAAYQAPLSMGFFRQEYWSEVLGCYKNKIPDSWKHGSSCGHRVHAALVYIQDGLNGLPTENSISHQVFLKTNITSLKAIFGLGCKTQERLC